MLIAQFSPGVGVAGNNAIFKDSNIIVSWASNAEVSRGYLDISDTNYTINGSNKVSFGSINNVLGPASGNSSNVISLGDHGSITLTFDHYIIDDAGPDFCIFSNSFDNQFLELAFVEVSSDGVHFTRFPNTSLTPINQQVNGFGYLDPTHIHNLAGKFLVGYGQPFDLSEINDPLVDVQKITHLRLIDVVGNIDLDYATFDTQDNPINDPYPTPFASGGFDLEAVGLINIGSSILNANQFENQKVKIYPNPANQKLNIINYLGEIEIYNNQGRLLKNTKLTNNSASVDIQDLPDGMYFIKGKNETYVINQKLIVKH